MPLQKYKGIQLFSNCVSGIKVATPLFGEDTDHGKNAFAKVQRHSCKVTNYIPWISLTSTLAPTERPGHPFASSVASSSESAFTMV
jgi:hypothetical protein